MVALQSGLVDGFKLSPAATSTDYAFRFYGRLNIPVAGTYTFYCNKKLPLMKSHRDRGMEGALVVVPFVEPVERREESRRIGSVDHHRLAHFSAERPYRVESRIVDSEQPAFLVTVAEPKRFVKLQTLRSRLKALAQTTRFAF